jgi:ATP-dependent DNA helicase RecG
MGGLRSAEPAAAPAGTEPPRSLGAALPQSRETLLAASIHWPRPSVLDVSIEALSGVGPKLAEAAVEAGISSVGDLLLRVPHSHRDRTVVPVASLEPGEQATIRIEVLGNAPRPFRRRGLSIVSVKVGDETGSLRATWFNQPWVAPKLKPGTRLLLTGSRDQRGFRVSEYEPEGAEPEGGDARTRELLPVHPATERLKAQRIRQWVGQAIGSAGNAVEALPAESRARMGLAGVADAIAAIHFPESEEDADGARRRLAFEELFLYQAILATRKRTHRIARPAPRLGRPGGSSGT